MNIDFSSAAIFKRAYGVGESLRAGIPLLLLRTDDEFKILLGLSQLILGRKVCVITLLRPERGLMRLTSVEDVKSGFTDGWRRSFEEDVDVDAVLDRVLVGKDDENGVTILTEADSWLEKDEVVRKLREIRNVQLVRPAFRQYVILVGSRRIDGWGALVPSKLRGQVRVIDDEPLSQEEVHDVLTEIFLEARGNVLEARGDMVKAIDVFAETLGGKVWSIACLRDLVASIMVRAKRDIEGGFDPMRLRSLIRDSSAL